MNNLFLHERDMTLVAEQWMLAQGLSCKKEYTLPWGICDLVGCSFQRENIKMRLSYGQRKSLGPKLRIMIFLSIPETNTGHSITKEALYQEYAPIIDKNKFENDLLYLEKNKFVVSSDGKHLQRVNGWYPLHNRLVAIELKIKRVPEALYQAKANLKFAVESYVGLPLDEARKVQSKELKNEFINSGVGLLGLWKNGCTVVINAKPSNDVNKIIQDHCIERFWRTASKTCQH